jgi:glucosamine kinase
VDVAIDAGQTGVRLGLARDGSVLRQLHGPGLAYGGPAGPAATVLRAIAFHRDELTAGAAAGTVCVGLTSVLGAETEYAALAEGLLDMAHAGALRLRPGVVLAAGTGAIALGVDGTGRTHQVDGCGYLYGDAGGGFWIGRHGLDAAVRGHDGRAAPGPLHARATAVFGDLGELAERLYPAADAVSRIAGFARHVIALAGTDTTAAGIVGAAAAELAVTVAAAVDTVATGDVSWTGRLLHGEPLRRRFADALAERRPEVRLVPPQGDGLAGAALLAANDDPGIHAVLIRTTTA